MLLNSIFWVSAPLSYRSKVSSPSGLAYNGKKNSFSKSLALLIQSSQRFTVSSKLMISLVMMFCSVSDYRFCFSLSNGNLFPISFLRSFPSFVARSICSLIFSGTSNLFCLPWSISWAILTMLTLLSRRVLSCSIHRWNSLELQLRKLSKCSVILFYISASDMLIGLLLR